MLFVILKFICIWKLELIVRFEAMAASIFLLSLRKPLRVASSRRRASCPATRLLITASMQWVMIIDVR